MLELLKRMARRAGAIALGFSAAACASTGDTGSLTAADTAPPPATAKTPPADYVPGPALWKVADGDTTIYLFGTVHALPPETEWFDQRIEQAFSASDEFVTEINMADQAAAGQTIAAQAMLTTGGTLRDLMSEEDRLEYEQALVTLGLPESALDPVEPWFAAMNLSLLPLLQSGYSPDTGVELVLEMRAEDKQRGALETIEEQIALFDMLPMEAQLAYLDQTVASMPDAVSSLDAMVEQWLEGDAVELAEMLNSEMDNEELYQRLLVDRNSNWVNWITQRMDAPGTVFIAVGAGHLAGNGSVQDQLGDRGFEVTRVWQ
mgnify:CR=1 FL=1